MTFGLEESKTETSFVRVRGVEQIQPFLDTFHSHGHVEIDTARMYCNGDTEKALGQLPMDDFKISIKIYVGFHGSYSNENLRKQVQLSLDTLQVSKVDILYLRSPDYATPIEVTLKVINDLYCEGLFERFGLSNYPSWQVAQICELCKQHGYVLPTVYQGLYNPFARSVEQELIPCLRQYNMVFYAYNALVGGILSGKYKFDQEQTSELSRFDPTTALGKLVRKNYWNTSVFDAVQILENAASAINLSLVEATMRWMAHHSALRAQDGVILGASSLKHLNENLLDLAKGPLPQTVVQAFDEAWEHVKACSPKYFTGPNDHMISFKRE
ncbi:hypothetical protein BGX28_005065 [Mortierella sp. GBA30]|nr:hypothetical protein BGX28_005065 [Mortierella sp. GBA30]